LVLEIWYACLEGPEAAAYSRVIGHIINGKAIITLPNHFATVASSQGITFQITPSSSESKELAVVEKNPERIVIHELYNGDGSYDFDFIVMAVRNGYYKTIFSF